MNMDKLSSFVKGNKRSIFIVGYILLLLNIAYVFVDDHLSRQLDEKKAINNIDRILEKLESVPNPSRYAKQYNEIQKLLNVIEDTDSLSVEELQSLNKRADEIYKGN